MLRGEIQILTPEKEPPELIPKELVRVGTEAMDPAAMVLFRFLS